MIDPLMMKRWRDENKASKAETPKAMTSLAVKKPMNRHGWGCAALTHPTRYESIDFLRVLKTINQPTSSNTIPTAASPQALGIEDAR